MKQKVFYKVVKDNSCVDYFTSIYGKGKYCLKYSLNKETKAPFNTKVLVFKNLESAIDFKNYHVYFGGRIFECVCKNVSKIKYLCTYQDEYALNKFWKVKNSHKSIPKNVFSLLDKIPESTYACDSVILTKEVFE